MKYDKEKREILSGKILNELDKFTLDFVRILEKHEDYVIVSGYVSILLGRSRASEDVDFLIPEMEYSKFVALFEELVSKGYECANTSDVQEAYGMLDEHAIRFYRKQPIPNIEFKKITNDIQKMAFENRVRVVLGEEGLYVSPLELQIVYKLSLMSGGSIEEISSDKDFEDAKHLLEVFSGELDRGELVRWAKVLKVEEKLALLER